MDIYDTICKRIEGFMKRDELLKEHTYIRIGGPADILVIPENVEDLRWLVAFLKKKKVRCFVMGNGTNLIFSDKGFRGVVIKTNKCFNEIRVAENKIFAGSGVDLMNLILKSAESGLSCLEPLAGIPGTVGGAIWMNAGAFEKEIKDCIEEVHYIDRNGEDKEEKMGFSYRESAFKKGDIIIGANFIFQRRERPVIVKEIEEIKRKREEKQPLDFPSAGSVFKNPDNKFAGEIIERFGMKTMRVGDAEVSSKHGNFIINRGNATSCDVRRLIQKIRDKIRKEEGIEFELEVEFVDEK
ncbi:UDP-N-acetylmuramate dehydrogenase [candidate division WOR-3 bacterium]|nr:UDP-N-acetylmuramate dehydrogenase [candidate division WOR-3 bacterium]MCK4576142.1 UDP-N-acetylmuramate dehydrogenase [candidate division WOR-3 bacterium]